jgi:outer membrane lipoprotein SlyB
MEKKMKFLNQLSWTRTKLLILASVVLGGCATTMPSGPSVMALPGSGKNFDQFRYDDADCRNFALAQIGGHAAGQSSGDAQVNQAVAATLVGALAGAAIGGQDAAGVGAGLGLLMGSAGGAEESRKTGRGGQKQYDNAYVQCMYAKGQRVPVPANFAQRASAAPGQYSSHDNAPQNTQPYAQYGQASPPVVYSPSPTQPPAPTRPLLPPQNAGTPPDYDAPNFPSSYASPGQCFDCGVVEAIRENLAEAREPDGRGALVGGLIGAAIGNQFGSGDGRALATIAGAIAGGAIANHSEEQRRPRSVGSFQITVRMSDGSLRHVNQSRPPAWQLGDRVRWVNGELYPR